MFRFKIPIAAVLLLGAAFIYLPGYYALGYLPRNLGNARVLGSYESLGLMDGCTIYVFELDKIVSNRIRKTGISYLQGDTKQRDFNNESNLYSEWRRTPVVHNENYVFAQNALYCSNHIKPDLLTQIHKGMNNASGYYIMSRNGEGIILVLPNERLAAYLYYG